MSRKIPLKIRCLLDKAWKGMLKNEVVVVLRGGTADL